MTGSCCAREAEVLRAVAREWREEADLVVAAHVAACARCSDVGAAAELLRVEHLREAQAARVPPPAAMWWRLERRLREERARRLQRIAVATQAVALAAALGGAAAVLQIVAPWLPGSRAMAADTWQAAVVVLTAWAQAAPGWTIPIAIVVGAWVLLVPAALYLGFADE